MKIAVRFYCKRERVQSKKVAEPLRVLEKRTILKALPETDGNKPAAARILGNR
jgi:DNA-binding NtrC family response regulator